MAKNSIWKTLAGLAVAGAAVGGAIAYVKKCKDVNDLCEDDFDDLMDEDVHCEPARDAKPVERTYTPLPTENPVEETAETAEKEAEEVSEEEGSEEEITEA